MDATRSIWAPQKVQILERYPYFFGAHNSLVAYANSRPTLEFLESDTYFFTIHQSHQWIRPNFDPFWPPIRKGASSNRAIMHQVSQEGSESRAPAMVLHDSSVAPVFASLFRTSFIKSFQNHLVFSNGLSLSITNNQIFSLMVFFLFMASSRDQPLACTWPL